MNCREFEDARMLAAYGEPAGEEFESHLAFCDECREAVEELSALRSAYARTQDETLPAALRSRLVGPRRVRWALAAAALAAVSLWLALRPGPAPAPVEPPPRWTSVERGISVELDRIDEELGWHELVMRR